MARKRKQKTSDSKSLVSVDSTLQRLTSTLVDPRVQTWLWQGAQGVRERILQLNFETLRRVTQRLPLVNAIINTRVDQILPFTRFATEEGERGFRFEIENRTEKFKGQSPDESEIIQLATFFEQTGFIYDVDREDDLADYVAMMVRDIYEIDQVATVLQPNRMGEVAAFWALDGATIFRTTDADRWKKGVRYVQMIDQKVYDEFTPERLLFDYKFKRSDIRFRGYGYSPIEQCVDIITTLLFGYNYIRDQLMRDRVPKGFISVMGDVSKPALDSIRNYWYAAMSGAGAQWSIPILPSGKDGVGVDFKELSHSNKDMEYHKTMMFVSSLIAAVLGMDLAEMGIKTDDSTALIGENLEPRIQTSKDRGLGSMLSFVEQHLNKILKKVTRKYRFKFVGLNEESDEKKADVRNKQIQGWRTVDEVREEDGLKPFNEDWSKIPLNAQAVQILLAQKSADQQEKMQQQGGSPFGGQPGEDQQGQPRSKEDLFGSEEDGKPETVNKSLKDFQKLTDRKEQTMRIIIE